MIFLLKKISVGCTRNEKRLVVFRLIGDVDVEGNPGSKPILHNLQQRYCA